MGRLDAGKLKRSNLEALACFGILDTADENMSQNPPQQLARKQTLSVFSDQERGVLSKAPDAPRASGSDQDC